MNIWLVTVGEPLPIDAGGARLLRAGLLAGLMTTAGHRVTWWTSTFDHWRKEHRFADDHRVEISNNYTLQLLHGCGYRSNVSIDRLRDHWQIARKFRTQSRSVSERPDLILCSFPPIELSVEVTRYGREFGVPTILDVRDLWPDIFVNLVPATVRPLARLFMAPYFRMTREAMRDCSAVFAINEPFRDWGLHYAGRAGTALDRSFPMGYPARPPDPAEQAKAREFWRGRGLENGSQKFTAIFAGTVGRQFQFEPIVEASKRLPDVQFVICGTGDRLDYVQSLAAGVPNVTFTGWVGAAEIWTLMRIAHVGLAPYHDEPSFTHSLPNKSLEYLSAGLPVVSSLPGALAKLLDQSECGLTYPNLDADALVDALRSLRSDPHRRQAMARNALAVYEENFRAEAIYGRMISHLETVRSAGATAFATRSR